MPTIKYPIPEAAAARTHCDAIAANAAVLKDVITGDPTSDTATNAISAIRHSLDELEAYAEQRQRVCQAANNCIEQHRRTTHTAELAALIAQRDALSA